MTTIAYVFAYHPVIAGIAVSLSAVLAVPFVVAAHAVIKEMFFGGRSSEKKG